MCEVVASEPHEVKKVQKRTQKKPKRVIESRMGGKKEMRSRTSERSLKKGEPNL